MIPLYYETIWAIEKTNNWESKNTLQKLFSSLKFCVFGGIRPSPTQCQRNLYEFQLRKCLENSMESEGGNK